MERPFVMKDGKTKWLMVTILFQISDEFSATAIKMSGNLGNGYDIMTYLES